MASFFLPRVNFVDREVGVRAVTSGAGFAEENAHDDARRNSRERGSEEAGAKRASPGRRRGAASATASDLVFVMVLFR